MINKLKKEILATTKDFTTFWKKYGPFRYALTSSEFPPILLEEEEWIFSDDIVVLLKELMNWDSKKMAIVEAPFNKNKKNVLKPDNLIPWKIENFPLEWSQSNCEAFTPVGYLTEAVAKNIETSTDITNPEYVESAFFRTLEMEIEKIGYTLLKPEPLADKEAAYIDGYLKEWRQDEDEG